MSANEWLLISSIVGSFCGAFLGYGLGYWRGVKRLEDIVKYSYRRGYADAMADKALDP